MSFFFGADEQDPAGPCVLRFRDSPSHDALAIQILTGESRIEDRAEWILAEDANHEGTVFACCRCRRPFDKSSEIEQVGGLDLILVRPWLLRVQDRKA